MLYREVNVLIDELPIIRRDVAWALAACRRAARVPGAGRWDSFGRLRAAQSSLATHRRGALLPAALVSTLVPVVRDALDEELVDAAEAMATGRPLPDPVYRAIDLRMAWLGRVSRSGAVPTQWRGQR